MLAALKDKFATWLMNMVQTEVALDNALQTYYLACDKEVSTMAAYRSMGVDPRAAPKFGWNLMDRRGINVSVNQQEVRGARGRWWPAALAVLLAAAGLAVAARHYGVPGQPAAPAQPPAGAAQAWQRVEWEQQPDGTWKEVPGTRRPWKPGDPLELDP